MTGASGTSGTSGASGASGASRGYLKLIATVPGQEAGSRKIVEEKYRYFEEGNAASLANATLLISQDRQKVEKLYGGMPGFRLRTSSWGSAPGFERIDEA